MRREFRDINIPPRQTEYALPLDTSVFFTFATQPDGLRLKIYAAGALRDYGGHGQILMGNGFAKLSELGLFDPFFIDGYVLPAKYFKIFFKIHLPKLKASGVTAECDLIFTERPAVLITIKSAADDKIEYDLRWQSSRDLMHPLDGLPGYVISGRSLYRGDEQSLRAVPYAFDGPFTADSERADAIRRLYASAPYMFDVRDPAFDGAKEQPAASAAVAEQIDRIREEQKPVRNRREYGGPALLSVGTVAVSRSGTSKYVHFIIEAKRLADFKSRPAEFVPFSCYWPTYQNMSREQRAWYFHWRAEFFAGNALKTDLSYILVTVYEIINRAYGQPGESLDRLLALWEAYRAPFPRLDRYMPQFCVDFIITNNLEVDFSEIIRRIPLPSEFLQPYIELYYNTALSSGLHSLPLFILSAFSDYDIRESRFYAEHENLCRDTIRRALSALDRASRDAKDVGLLESFAVKPVNVGWDAFRGAVVGRAQARRIEAEYLPYSKSPKLRTFLAGVIKYIENNLRKRERFLGRLRGFELTPAAIAVLDRVLTDQPDAAAATLPTIDLGRALELEAQSWENTRRLIEAAGDMPDMPEDIPDAAAPSPTVTGDDIQNMDGEGDARSDFPSKLTDFQRAFFELLSGGAEYAELATFAASEFSFPEAVIDEINEIAADILGDIIIDPVSREIFEEFRDL